MVDKKTIFSKVLFSNLYTWDVKRFNVAEISYNKNYNIVPFSKVLKDTTMEWVNIEDDKHYSILGVRTYGKGVYINRTSVGKDLKMKKYQKSQKDHLFWCKVDTKNGAFGIITEDFENSYGSSNMSYLKIRTDRIDLNYLQLLFQSVKINQYMDSMVVGVTNRKYISKDDLLSNIFIPLPCIEEQNILIKKYEATIAEAEQCEKDVEQLETSIEKYLFGVLGVEPVYEQQNTSNLLFARYKNLNTRWEWDNLTFAIQKSMENCLFPVRTIDSKLSLVTRSWKNKNEQASFNYIEIGGIDPDANTVSINEIEVSKAPSRATQIVKTGDLIIGTTRPYLKKFAIITEENNNDIASSGFQVIEEHSSYNLVYVLEFLKSQIAIKQFEQLMTGALYPAINAEQLKTVRLPFPPIEIQNQIAEHITEIKNKIQAQRDKAIYLRELAKKEFEEAVFSE